MLNVEWSQVARLRGVIILACLHSRQTSDFSPSRLRETSLLYDKSNSQREVGRLAAIDSTVLVPVIQLSNALSRHRYLRTRNPPEQDLERLSGRIQIKAAQVRSHQSQISVSVKVGNPLIHHTEPSKSAYIHTRLSPLRTSHGNHHHAHPNQHHHHLPHNI